MKGDTVTLKAVEGGRVVSLKVAELSQEDQDFLVRTGRWKAEEASGEAKGGGKGRSKEAKDNYKAPWPRWAEVAEKPKIAIVSEDPEAGKFIYHSPHYEYTCDVRLNKSLVQRLSRMFEATFEAMRLLPLNNQKALAFDQSERMPIILCEKESTYLENGGPPGSAGVYFQKTNSVLVPLSSLGVKKMGSGYIIDRDSSNKVLVHELVHQLTDEEYYSVGARGWFTEGLAEYVCNSPYLSSGKIKFSGNVDEITDAVCHVSKEYGRGRMLGYEIEMPDLRKFMMQSYQSFVADAGFNYGFGTLMVTWIFEEARLGNRTALVNFLKAMHDGQDGEELVKTLRNGRSWDQFCQEMEKFWKRKGVKIRFGPVTSQ